MIYLIQGSLKQKSHIVGYLRISNYINYIGFTTKELATSFDDSVDSLDDILEEYLTTPDNGLDYTVKKIKLYDIDELVNL